MSKQYACPEVSAVDYNKFAREYCAKHGSDCWVVEPVPAPEYMHREWDKIRSTLMTTIDEKIYAETRWKDAVRERNFITMLLKTTRVDVRNCEIDAFSQDVVNKQYAMRLQQDLSIAKYKERRYMNRLSKCEDAVRFAQQNFSKSNDQKKQVRKLLRTVCEDQQTTLNLCKTTIWSVTQGEGVSW
jgi:hypothetical protein